MVLSSDHIATTIKSLEKAVEELKASHKEELTALEDNHLASIEALKQEKHSKLGELNQLLEQEKQNVRI